MADIFISYSSRDAAVAEIVEGGLAAAGLTIWRDRSPTSGLQAGDAFDDIIEREIDDAKCVLALLSRHSVRSTYVRAELRHAQKKIVPCLIEKCTIPVGVSALVGHLHYIDLHKWRVDGDPSAWESLVKNLHTRLMRGHPATVTTPSPPKDQTRETSATTTVKIVNTGDVQNLIGVAQTVIFKGPSGNG